MHVEEAVLKLQVRGERIGDRGQDPAHQERRHRDSIDEPISLGADAELELFRLKCVCGPKDGFRCAGLRARVE